MKGTPGRAIANLQAQYNDLAQKIAANTETLRQLKEQADDHDRRLARLESRADANDIDIARDLDDLRASIDSMGAPKEDQPDTLA